MKSPHSNRGRCSVPKTFALALVLGCSLGLFDAAYAEVLDIAPDGAVTTISAPAPPHSQRATPTAQRSDVHGSIDVRGALRAAADRYAVNPRLVEAVAWTESRFRQEAVSPRGAIGVMQLMPSAAADLGADPHDLSANINGGVAYLSQLLARFDNRVPLALAAYNAGPAAVMRHGGIPPYRETQAYVRDVMARAGDIQATIPFVIEINR